ncbi:hypothetical protein HOG21_02525 [bacterium]|nr:hypothetical protein [bacterium]
MTFTPHIIKVNSSPLLSINILSTTYQFIFSLFRIDVLLIILLENKSKSILFLCHNCRAIAVHQAK